MNGGRPSSRLREQGENRVTFRHAQPLTSNPILGRRHVAEMNFCRRTAGKIVFRVQGLEFRAYGRMGRSVRSFSDI